MIPRKPPRIPFPKARFYSVESKPEATEISSRQTENAGGNTPETTEKAADSQKFYHKQNRLKPGQSDPKLASAILELAQGPGAVRVPPNILGLHMRFAKAQYGGHMGARKFAMLNLPRMKFYNPQLDIKVIRRPWQGKTKNVEGLCEANIIRADGTTEKIGLQGKRSGLIYEEIMRALGAEDLRGEAVVAKEKAEVIAKPYLKWV